MKTAVEWLIDNLSENDFLWLSDKPEMDDLIKIISQAKKMEKQQIIDFAEDYQLYESDKYPLKTFEEYYNKIFIKKGY